MLLAMIVSKKRLNLSQLWLTWESVEEWGVGGSLDLQYDESAHSMLKPSLRPLSEINKFGRPSLPSPALAECCVCTRRAGTTSLSQWETNLGQTVCLGKGCERRTSPSNQLQSYAETAWLWPGLRELGPTL